MNRRRLVVLGALWAIVTIAMLVAPGCYGQNCDGSSGTWAVIVALISQSAPCGGSLPTCSSGTAAWRSWSSSSASSIHASSCEVVQSSRSEQAASRKNSRSSKWYRRWAQAVSTP